MLHREFSEGMIVAKIAIPILLRHLFLVLARCICVSHHTLGCFTIDRTVINQPHMIANLGAEG